MPYKKQKAISSNKKHNKYGLMTDLGIRNTLHWSRDTDKHIAKSEFLGNKKSQTGC